MKKNIFLVPLAALCFAACEPTAVEPESLYITEEAVDAFIAEDGGTFYNLNDFVEEFMTEEGNFLSEKTPYRDRAATSDGVYYFSIDTLPSTGPSIYIRGRVVTEDIAGNFYKSMVIQQIVNGEQQALRLSVDASSVSGQYAIGQEILIRVNGFAIGRYANQPQLCVPSYNGNIYAGNYANEKVGWAPGRIPGTRFQKATTLIGVPDKSKIHVDTIAITDFTQFKNKADIADIRTWDGKLICLKGVHFTGQYSDYGALTDCTTGNPETDQNANVFAPTTGNIGFPQARAVSDGTNVTFVATSEYAKYARFYLPGCDANGISGAADYTGNVTGILGYYEDNALDYHKPAPYAYDEYNWSITLRSLAFMGWGTEDDIQMRNQEGEPWTPKEYGTK